MSRLKSEGLPRHEAIHAIGSVAAEHFFEVLKSTDQEVANTVQARYDAAVERLTAKSWREEYGS
jgi:hypothetical protein